MSGLEKDNAQAVVSAEVESCKREITLDAESQSPEFSGHESAPYGSGGPGGNSGNKAQY